MRVLISDQIAEESRRILEQEPKIAVDAIKGLPEEGLKAIIGRYGALIVRSATKVTEEVIEAADRLRVIGRAGAGVDNIDVEAATKRGIIVMNTPGGNAISAAEHTLSMLLALYRNIPQAVWSIKRQEWAKSRYTGVEMHGKTLGVIGLGKVGSEVALRAHAFGMKIRLGGNHTET